MANHHIVSREDWLEARKAHLQKEKEFTRQRDQLSQERRDMPWVKVDKEYVFEGPNGKESLSDLFEDKSQLMIYHFMFGPDWDEGCPSCSFWADNYNGIVVHLKHRDITMLAISKAKLEKLEAYKKRMGWGFKWGSSFDNNFNRDYHVSFTEEETQKGEMYYNYHRTHFPSSEGPGISVFYKDEDGTVYHTYSCYARGLDMLNGAYHMIDLTPKGRMEQGQRNMYWLKRHDQYED